MCLKRQLGIKLIFILNKLNKGRYELEYNAEKNIYSVVLYNTANYGVYSAIYVPKHNTLDDSLLRLENTIEIINKYG